jgi:hypothetical protein
VEARAGIEPADRGFAVHGITTLLPGQKREYRRFLAKKCNKSKLLIKRYRLMDDGMLFSNK